MAIHDNDPERRNLIVMSLAFIIFYFGYGQLTNNELKIQIVNITFNNMNFLKYFSYAILIWFFIRYWQTHQGLIISGINAEVESFKENNIVVDHIIRKTGCKDGVKIEKFDLEKGTWVLRFKEIKNPSYNERGILNSYSTVNSEPIELSGEDGKAIVFMLYIKAIFTKSSFFAYATPYILFLFALFTIQMGQNVF